MCAAPPGPRDRAQGFHCEVKGQSGSPGAGEGWKTLTPKHQPQPEKPSLGLGNPKASVCHLDRNKLESDIQKERPERIGKNPKHDQDRTRKELLQNTKSQQADLSLHQKLPAPNCSPAETPLEQAMEQRSQPFPIETSFSFQGQMRPIWEVWEHLQTS